DLHLLTHRLERSHPGRRRAHGQRVRSSPGSGPAPSGPPRGHTGGDDRGDPATGSRARVVAPGDKFHGPETNPRVRRAGPAARAIARSGSRVDRRAESGSSPLALVIAPCDNQQGGVSAMLLPSRRAARTLWLAGAVLAAATAPAKLSANPPSPAKNDRPGNF